MTFLKTQWTTLLLVLSVIVLFITATRSEETPPEHQKQICVWRNDWCNIAARPLLPGEQAAVVSWGCFYDKNGIQQLGPVCNTPEEWINEILSRLPRNDSRR